VAEEEVVVTDVAVIGEEVVAAVVETAMNVDNQATLPETAVAEEVVVAGEVVVAEAGTASNVGSLVILPETAEVVVVAEEVVEEDVVPGLEADLMTVGDVHHQGADQGLEADQDMADVPEIVQNMDLVQNLVLTLLPNLMEMDAQCLVPGQGLGRLGQGQGPRIEIKS